MFFIIKVWITLFWSISAIFMLFLGLGCITWIPCGKGYNDAYNLGVAPLDILEKYHETIPGDGH